MLFDDFAAVLPKGAASMLALFDLIDDCLVLPIHVVELTKRAYTGQNLTELSEEVCRAVAEADNAFWEELDKSIEWQTYTDDEFEDYGFEFEPVDFGMERFLDIIREAATKPPERWVSVIRKGEKV